MESVSKKIRIFRECGSLGWGLWQCPPFLFLVLGTTTIISMVAASILSYRIFKEPEVPTIIIVSFIAVIFLIIGNFIISGFNKIAESNRMKSEFISIVSHQLRSPLSIFKWTLETLQYSIHNPQMQAETEHYLKALTEANQKMIRIINTLLDVTRIESHTLKLQKEEVEIVNLAKKIIHDFSHSAESSHISLALKADDNIPPILADRQRIQMIIETLIDNAIRYSQPNSSVNVSVKKKMSTVIFKVTDIGIGIPLSQQKFIFQKFFRAANSLQYQTEGTGIDLYISKYIIESMGGTIQFTSQENNGSIFWFILPIKH